MELKQADKIRAAVAQVLRVAKDNGAIEVVFRAEDVAEAVVGQRTNHPNVISALTSDKMQSQTGFAAGVADREYQSSAARISFNLT